MTKFSSRAEVLASGAREVTMEELDWVSGGGNVEDSSAIIGTLWQNNNAVGPIPEIVVTGNPFNNFHLFSAAISSQFGNLTLTYSNVAPNLVNGQFPNVTNGFNIAQTDPNGDADNDGDPNSSDPTPFDGTIVVTAGSGGHQGFVVFADGRLMRDAAGHVFITPAYIERINNDPGINKIAVLADLAIIATASVGGAGASPLIAAGIVTGSTAATVRETFGANPQP